MTSQGGPLKHASDTDYTNSLIALTSVVLALSTIVVSFRFYARHLSKVGSVVEDVLVATAWLGLLANIIANYMMANTNAVSTTPPTADQAVIAERASNSVGITYPVSVLASKLSLLFLLRRIFGMRVLWFCIGWYTIFVMLFPIWITLAFTIAGLQFANKLSRQEIFRWGVPSVSFINAFTDLFVLILPIRMVVSLQMSWKQRMNVLAIFALGSSGTVVSLIRTVWSVQSSSGNWDLRYVTYSELMMGVAEAGTILICACLPSMGPLFARVADFTKRNLTNRQLSGYRSSTYSLGSQDHTDNIPINKRENVIHRRIDYQVKSDLDDGSSTEAI